MPVHPETLSFRSSRPSKRGDSSTWLLDPSNRPSRGPGVLPGLRRTAFVRLPPIGSRRSVLAAGTLAAASSGVLACNTRTFAQFLVGVRATVGKFTDGAVKLVPGAALCRRGPASGAVTPGTMSKFFCRSVARIELDFADRKQKSPSELTIPKGSTIAG